MSAPSPPHAQNGTLKIATRGSQLALWQAHYVASLLDVRTEICILKTQGDNIQNTSLHKVEGKGFFTKEIEAALLTNQADIAVHSYKDLPTEEVLDLTIAAVPCRAPVRDVLVMRQSSEQSDNDTPWPLQPGATIGTSSLRRQAHILASHPDVNIVPLRGNVPTRISKVTQGEIDAVVLAEAGLSRLELLTSPDLICIPLDVTEVCPAAAQGALAIQTRTNDKYAQNLLLPLHDPVTAQCVSAERILLARFGGGCHLPLGATCHMQGEHYSMYAVIAEPSGKRRLIASAQGPEPHDVAENCFQQLAAQGAHQYV